MNRSKLIAICVATRNKWMNECSEYTCVCFEQALLEVFEYGSNGKYEVNDWFKSVAAAYIKEYAPLLSDRYRALASLDYDGCWIHELLNLCEDDAEFSDAELYQLKRQRIHWLDYLNQKAINYAKDA